MAEFANFELKGTEQSVEQLQKKLVETCNEITEEVRKSLVDVIKETSKIEIPTQPASSIDGQQILVAIENMQRAQEAQAKKQLEVLKSLVAQLENCKTKQREQPKASFTQN